MMTSRFFAASAALALCVCIGGTALAQPSVPAPAKTVDPHAKQGAAYGAAVAALPDWNGVWQFTGGFVFDPATAVGARDGNAGSDFGNPGGAHMTSPPYKPEWQAIYDQRVKDARAGKTTDYVADCRVEGMPRLLGGVPGAIELVVMPRVVFMTWAYLNQTRRIYTDGRPHPPRDVAYGRDLGHSVGRWEGDELVVDTVDMLEGAFDITEAPHSDQVHSVERWRMRPDGALEAKITITDPVVFTRPWTVTRVFTRLPGPGVEAKTPGPDWANVESIFCTVNRNQRIDGVESVQLPGEYRERR